MLVRWLAGQRRRGVSAAHSVSGLDELCELGEA
jgi:hypothetical protein